jgi:hypothetical protein
MVVLPSAMNQPSKVLESHKLQTGAVLSGAIYNSVILVTFTRAKPWDLAFNAAEMAMREFLVLVLALAIAGGAATIVRAADRSPTPVPVADYSGASW